MLLALQTYTLLGVRRVVRGPAVRRSAGSLVGKEAAAFEHSFKESHDVFREPLGSDPVADATGVVVSVVCELKSAGTAAKRDDRAASRLLDGPIAPDPHPPFSQLGERRKDVVIVPEDQALASTPPEGSTSPDRLQPCQLGPQSPTNGPRALSNARLDHLSRKDRRVVAAERQLDALKEDSALAGMHPERLAVQQDLVNARSAARVLAVCVEDGVAAMDAVNLTTAVHRIAKLSGSSAHAVLGNDVFVGLLRELSGRLPELGPRGLINTLWALVQLEVSPAWLPELLDLCLQRHGNFVARDLSTALSCLAKAPCLHACPQGEQLKLALATATSARITEFGEPLMLVCVAAALSKLKLRDEQVFARIADQTLAVLSGFATSDIASITWAFANLNLSHGELFRQIRHVLEQQIKRCGPRELVQISWAFSKVGKADEELLSEVFGPEIRAKMLEFDAPRDLCTLAWAFSNASVRDLALFNDLAHVLSPRVKLMNAHDVSSVVVAFSSIEYAHQRLFRALQKHTRTIVHTFSPLQLSRVIYGFGVSGIDDEALLRLLCEQVLRQRHLLHARNIVEIVTGLAEAEYTPKRVLRVLLREPEALTTWLGVEDSVQLLHCLSRIPSVRLEDEYLHAAASHLLGAVRQRAAKGGWWRLEARGLADLLEALRIFGPSEGDVLLIEAICRQAPRAFLRAAATQKGHSEVLRLWGAFAELTTGGRAVVRKLLHRSSALVGALEESFPHTLGCPEEGGTGMGVGTDVDPHSAALLAYACARLGYDGLAACQLLDGLCEVAVRHCGEAAPSSTEPWWSLLVWSLAEMNHKPDLARSFIKIFLRERYCKGPEAVHGHPGPANVSEPSVGALLRVAWSCVALMVEVPGALLRELCQRLGGAAPSNSEHLQLLRVVAVECNADSSGCHAAPDGAYSPLLRMVAMEPQPRWSQGASLLSATPAPPARAVVADQKISHALVRLRIPHESPAVLGGAHRVSAALPDAARKCAVVVLGPDDLAAPSRTVLGPALVRRRHLTALGWHCLELMFHEVQRAELEGGLEALLADRLALLGEGPAAGAGP